jgi:hypothetical protein
VTGHKTVRIACVCMLALGLLVAASASSSAAGDLHISVSTTPTSPVAGGANFTITAVVANTSGTDVSSYTADILLPTGVSFVSSAQTCSSDSGNQQLIHCQRPGGVADQTTDLINITAAAASGAAGPATISPGLSNVTPGVTTSATPLQLTIDQQADLGIALTGVPTDDLIAGGAGFTATATVTNDGPSESGSDWTASVTLGSADLAFGALPNGCTVDNTGLIATCDGSVVPPNGSAQFALPVSAPHNATAGSKSIQAAVDPGSVAEGTDTNPDTDSQSVNVITQADLALDATTTHGAGASDPYVAGDATKGLFSYNFKVTNNGPSDHNEDYSVGVDLPIGFDATPTSECDVTGDATTGESALCTASNTLAPGDSHTFTLGVAVRHYVTDNTYQANAQVSTGTSATPEPPDAPDNDKASASVGVKTVADLQVTGMTVSSSSCTDSGTPGTPCLNADGTQTATLTLTFQNNGPSDAQNATFTAPTGLVTQTVSTISPLPMAPSDIRTVTIVVKAEPCLGHQNATTCTPARQTGPIAIKSTPSVNVASPTTDPTSGNNSITLIGNNKYLNIDTVASPPRNPFGIPGTGNAILTWQNPASNGGQAIQNFLITVTPAVGSPFTLPAVPFNATPASACGAVAASNCYQLTVTGLQNDNGTYTFAIRAQNAVGASDAATTTATPSVNAKNASVPTNTATTLTTCTTATPTTPVCVVYTIPSGAGGVFGAGGLVALPTGLCGINVTCLNSTGAQNLGSLAGYNDRTHPLIETITWDSSRIDSSFYTNVPACPNNSTSTICYPNNVKIYYEDTFSLLHCGVGFTGTCDPNTLVDHSQFPVVPGTVLNLHFCAQAINSGGAGNKNYARPKPSPLGVYNGYNDPSGSACIKSMNALGSVNSPGANRDIQVVINMTSDSDGLAGRH